jgi:teichuronic acid biosynthesis glycosyltransferase TuaC
VRVLVVTNFEPDEAAPHRGRWVVDQVEALRELGVEVELMSFPPGKGNYLPASREIRRMCSNGAFDLVHAHYGLVGLSAWLAGARPLVVTYHGTDVRHPQVGAISRFLARRIALTAPASRALLSPEGGRKGLGDLTGPIAVLPCGPSLDRFEPLPMNEARRALGLEPDGRYLLFPADPARPEKRADLARALASRAGATLLEGGRIEPEQMPIWMSAANAVAITSLYEGFGLACLEALACRRPILTTPVGVAPFATAGLEGALCEEFDLDHWSGFLESVLSEPGTEVAGGRQAAERFGARRMAERVLVAYREIVSGPDWQSDRASGKDCPTGDG